MLLAEGLATCRLKPCDYRTEWLATRLGKYLTKSAGITIVFESAIVPRFNLKDSRITFRNVYISRGPVKEYRDHSVGRRGFRRDQKLSNLATRTLAEFTDWLGWQGQPTEKAEHVLTTEMKPADEAEDATVSDPSDLDQLSPQRRYH